jgi:hypothetical protein
MRWIIIILVRNMIEKHQVVQLLAPVQLLNLKCINLLRTYNSNIFKLFINWPDKKNNKNRTLFYYTIRTSVLHPIIIVVETLFSFDIFSRYILSISNQLIVCLLISNFY